jgi:hypothetical protein
MEKYVLIEQIPLILLNFLCHSIGGKKPKEKSPASNRGKMSVKRAFECKRGFKGFKRVLRSHNGRIALKCSHPPVTTSGNYSYDHGQSPNFTNQVGNKIVLLRTNNRPIKSSFPMQVPSAHAL